MAPKHKTKNWKIIYGKKANPKREKLEDNLYYTSEAPKVKTMNIIYVKKRTPQLKTRKIIYVNKKRTPKVKTRKIAYAKKGEPQTLKPGT